MPQRLSWCFLLVMTSMSESGLVQQDDEGDADSAVEHEGRFASAPLLGLPAGEPLAADHHEAAEPERETQAEPGEGHAFGGMELRCAAAIGPGEDHCTREAEQRGRTLDGDDQPEGNAVHEGRNDGPALQPGVGEHAVHAEQVLHQPKIALRVTQVVPGHEQRKRADQRHEQNLAKLDDVHKVPATTRPFTRTVRASAPPATRSAASSASVISRSARLPSARPWSSRPSRRAGARVTMSNARPRSLKPMCPASSVQRAISSMSPLPDGTKGSRILSDALATSTPAACSPTTRVS